MEETKEFDTAMDKVARVYATAPDVVAAVALNFIHARFSARNWVDATTENWPPRKASTRWGATPRNKGRALLVDTGKLIRSFRKEEANTERVVIATDDPKARVHNEGFKGDVVQHVRPHTRVRRGRKENVQAFTRTIHQNIPRRRFIGQSQVLNEQIKREITAMFIKALK